MQKKWWGQNYIKIKKKLKICIRVALLSKSSSIGDFSLQGWKVQVQLNWELIFLLVILLLSLYWNLCPLDLASWQPFIFFSYQEPLQTILVCVFCGLCRFSHPLPQEFPNFTCWNTSCVSWVLSTKYFGCIGTATVMNWYRQKTLLGGEGMLPLHVLYVPLELQSSQTQQL